MKQTPILYSTPMVQAVLDDLKKETRRVVMPQPIWNGARWVWPLPKRVHHLMAPGVTSVCSGSREWHQYMPHGCSPYGQPGDLLYVREAWAAHFHYDNVPPREIPTDEDRCLWYDADEVKGEEHPCWANASKGRYRAARFMPKAFSRLWLKLTGVRVEQVQDITFEGVVAEGLRHQVTDTPEPSWYWGDDFRKLWDGLNARRGFGWDVNPWVWVLSFERCDAPSTQAKRTKAQAMHGERHHFMDTLDPSGKWDRRNDPPSMSFPRR